MAPFGGLPRLEQIRIVRAARVIVAPHGAGLAHLAFARRGTSVLELTPLGRRPGARIAMAHISLAHISRMRGHRHTLWLAPGASGSERWRGDLPALLPGVARLCREADG
ncbi:MAG: glycosyltransferase 61 family protein [Acetobacteraceae bacterium]